MTFYDGIYPFYNLQRTPFIFNLDILTILLVFLVCACVFLLIFPGIRGKTRLFWVFRISISLFIGAVIVVLNFTSNWATASVKANSTYKAFSSAEVSTEVGLLVGLSGINITLKGNPVNQLNETINYNEMFQWTDSSDNDYADALQRGLPNPILYIAEKFTSDSPCGLYYQYRFSGRYASATMWTAFCCWLIANILFSMPVILYAGYMTVTTGAFIFFSLASFATIQNLPPCVFTIGKVSFQVVFSGSFWLALAIGVLCTILGLLVVVLDYAVPGKLREAFSVVVDDEGEYPDFVEEYLNPHFLEEVTCTETTVEGNNGRVQSL